jgi:RNA polymerase sigma factor (sigma-70 family)
MRSVATPRPADTPSGASTWVERSGRLYEELRRPARAMIRRAFRGAFGDDEIEDIYSSAWVGTLRALERRHDRLDDEEIRRYVLTAVAHHASKELRRRDRRPTAPLEAVQAVAGEDLRPDERAAKLEDSRITRDLLASLPPRRRAVMLLRYGWGLEPRQVCRLIKGLSPRLSQGDHARRRRADREASPPGARRVVRRPRAGAEGLRRRDRRRGPTAPGAEAPVALPPLHRLRWQAQRPPSRSRRLDRGARRHRRGGR